MKIVYTQEACYGLDLKCPPKGHVLEAWPADGTVGRLWWLILIFNMTGWRDTQEVNKVHFLMTEKVSPEMTGT
jgi:hypothetical protein